jgi:6,7-dimethyl-8-ribityllumazine synthase
MRTDQAPAAPLPSAHGMHVAVLVSRFNPEVTGSLRAAAEDALRAAAAFRVDVHEVPGAFELPLAARAAAATRQFDAVVCLGCLVRGETPHFDYIASAVAHGITKASLDTGVPMAFGVLTTDTIEQARARALPDETNKGWEAAAAAVEMVHVLRRIGEQAIPPIKV